MSDKTYELLNRQRLTAPHFIAYSWILDRLARIQKRPDLGPLKVLDFGSRYSPLPTMMAGRGYQVCATDRDAGVVDWQRGIASCYGVTLDAVQWEPKNGFDKLELDVVTACWAIQHNPVLEQEEIVKRLVAMLAPGGRLLIVQSFSPRGTFHQTERADPQWVLGAHDFESTIVLGSGCQVVATPTEWSTFRYVHGTDEGEWCEPSLANAVVCELRKP